MAAKTGHLGPTVFRSSDWGKTWKEEARPPAFPQAEDPAKGPAAARSGRAATRAHAGRASPTTCRRSSPSRSGCGEGSRLHSHDDARGVNVFFPTHLSQYTGGMSEIEAGGATLDELARRLDARYPGIRFRIIDEQGRIRQHIRFFVNGDLAKTLAQPLAASDEVHIVVALSVG